MEIILKQDMKNLGEKDQIVKVRDGYARNFLLPKGYAVLATDSNRKVLSENLRQVAHRQEKLKTEALGTADRLKAITLVIEQIAGTEGRIHGNVTPLQVSNILKSQHGIEIDRRRITFNEEIKNLGSYIALLNLHKEVKVELPFEIVQKAK